MSTAEQLIARLQAAPDDLEAYYALKAHYIGSKDFGSAINLIVGFAGEQRDPIAASNAYVEAGTIAGYMEDLATAAQCYQRAVEVAPEHVPALYAARELYRRLGNLQAAASLYDREAKAERDPNRSFALFHELAALRADELGDLAGAIVALRRALALRPQDQETKAALASMLLRHAEVATDDETRRQDRERAAELWLDIGANLESAIAIEYFEAALDAAPAHEVALERFESLAPIYGRDDQLPFRWINYLASAAHSPAAATRRFRLGAIFAQAAQWNEVVTYLEPLIELRHREAMELLRRAYRELGRADALASLLTLSLETADSGERVDQLQELIRIARANNDAGAIAHHAQALLAIETHNEEALDALIPLLIEHERHADLALNLERKLELAKTDEAKLDLGFQIVALQEGPLDRPLEAIRLLNRLRDLAPDRTDIRDRLSELQLRFEPSEAAVGLLDARITEANDSPAKAALLRKRLALLGQVSTDDDRLFAAAASILEVVPDDLETLELMEALDRSAGRFERLVQTLRYRLELSEKPERARILKTIAAVHATHLNDDEHAAEAYQQALEIDPVDEESLDVLSEIRIRQVALKALVMFLKRLVSNADTPNKGALYRRMAILLETRLRNEKAAAEAWESALEYEASEAGLRFLRRYFQKAGEPEREFNFGSRLAAQLSADSDEYLELQIAQARLLSEELERPQEARALLEALLESTESLEALIMLSAITERLDEPKATADLLDRILDLAPDASLRAESLSRLATLCEGKLDDPRRAEPALLQLRTLDPSDESIGRRLVAIYERMEDYRSLVAEIDGLASFPLELGEKRKLLHRAAEIAAEHFETKDEAIRRWAILAQSGDAEAEAALATLCEQTKRAGDLANFYVTMARVAQPGRAQSQRWRQAAFVFENEMNDLAQALEANVRALATNMDDPTLLDDVDRVATASKAWRRLDQVYEGLLRKTANPERQIELLLRHAELLHISADDPNGAIDRALRAFGLDPLDDRPLRLAEELAPAAGRVDELLIAYDRRSKATLDPKERLQALFSATRICRNELQDEERARAYLQKAIELAAADDADLDLLEKQAQSIDETNRAVGTTWAVAEVVRIYRLIADQPARSFLSASLLLRAAHLLENELGDPIDAYGCLTTALEKSPGDARLLRDTSRLAIQTGHTEAFARLLEELISHVLDADATQMLLEEQCRLLAENLGRPSEAADAIRKLLRFRPDDMELLEKHERCLRAAGRFQDLLAAFQRRLDASNRHEEKVRLAKAIALLWDAELKNRWEALEAWQRAARLAPEDDEVIVALRRLSHSTRRISSPDGFFNDEETVVSAEDDERDPEREDELYPPLALDEPTLTENRSKVLQGAAPSYATSRESLPEPPSVEHTIDVDSQEIELAPQKPMLLPYDGDSVELPIPSGEVDENALGSEDVELVISDAVSLVPNEDDD